VVEPNEIRLNEYATDATLALVAKFPETKALDIRRAEFNDRAVAQLTALTELEQLDAILTPISPTRP